jgi:diguanylate cyclase
MPDPSTSPAVTPASGGEQSHEARRKREGALRFVRRVHSLRTLGLGLGSLCVGSVFWLHAEPWFLWVAVALHAFVWPHVAKRLAARSSQPTRCEFRQLALDSALGGVWIALMKFNLLPSVLLATMLTVDKIAVGGMRFALPTTSVMFATCILTSAALGFPVDVATPTEVVVACIPFLASYPLAISNVMYALQNTVARQNRRLLQISRTDELTGLANRREGFAAAEHALERHRRSGAPAVLVILDIDRFKRVNDRWGHPAGDQVLCSVANLLRQCSRTTDTPARYAGDEFLLVLPDTDLTGAAEMARRIRAQLCATTFEHAPDVCCTLSLGAAEVHSEMANVEDWIQQADAALYHAKATGRDRLVNAPGLTSSGWSDIEGVVDPRSETDAAPAKLRRSSLAA